MSYVNEGDVYILVGEDEDRKSLRDLVDLGKRNSPITITIDYSAYYESWMLMFLGPQLCSCVQLLARELISFTDGMAVLFFTRLIMFYSLRENHPAKLLTELFCISVEGRAPKQSHT